MNHLIDGCIEAIKNGPINTTSNNINDTSCRMWIRDYTLGVEKALKHYQNGGTIFNRP